MQDTHKTLVTLATYNEIDNLPSLVNAIGEQLPKADILIVDDNSPDGTGQWCDQQKEQGARINCLHREAKLGLGTATIAAMRYAIDNQYELMLNMDADFSHHPQYLPTMVAGMQPDNGQTCDCLIGSRYIAEGRTEGWPLIRRLMSRGVNIYARTLLGLRTKDCSGAFRCYRVALLREIDFNKVRSTGYSFQEEILWHLKQAGARFEEIPIVFANRERGKSKINAREAGAAVWILFRLGVKNWIGF